MPKRKPTKHQDDILRNIRPPDRYDPKARSAGGPWRMVKCKDGAYVCYEQHLEIIDNLRRNAEESSGQSPHDGIHTCSKGCSKPGCNRGLRDTIDEQDAQIVALKQDLLEKAAELRRLHQERVHDLNAIGGEQEENARLKAKVERIEPELEQRCRELNLSLAHEAVQLRKIEELKAEVERLCKAGDAFEQALQHNPSTLYHIVQCVRAWNAAKEGRPNE